MDRTREPLLVDAAPAVPSGVSKAWVALLVFVSLAVIVPLAVVAAGSSTPGDTPLPADSMCEGSGRGDRPFGPNFASRSRVMGTRGAASSFNSLATQAAVEVLRLGGTAADAAIAASAVMTVVEPFGCGIGGDVFALVYDANSSRVYGLMGSGAAPLNVTYDDMKALLNGSTFLPSMGRIAASTVPGAVDGWWALKSRFGSSTLSFADVLGPAVTHARRGFPVAPLAAELWRGAADAVMSAAVEFDFPAEYFNETFRPNGRSPSAGEIFRNEDYASTLEKLAADPHSFYEGEVADVLASFFEEAGVLLSREDLAAHQSTWVDAINVTYRGHTVYALPPSTQGLTLLQTLNILEGFDLTSMGLNSVSALHHMVEAKKVAFADRKRYIGDPSHTPIPVQALLSKEYAAQRRALMSDRAAPAVPPGVPDVGSTIYVTAADEEGNMVSLIQSLSGYFGSGLTPPGLGFSLQNRAAGGFSMVPSSPAVYGAGRQPFHTLTPGFATLRRGGGEEHMSFGTNGASGQPQTHTQLLVNMIDFALDVQSAADAARFRHTGSDDVTGPGMTDGGQLALETGIGAAEREGLRERGHTVQTAGSYGGLQVILRNVHGAYEAASDSRKDGAAAAY